MNRQIKSVNPNIVPLATPCLQVVKGSRHLLLEFWDPLHISGTVEAGNFKVGMQLDHEGSYR